MGDEVIQIGERYYIKSTARLIDLESDGVVENTAYAREEAEKKGMDGSQVTGASSSYARKYALNGLFAIDDTKDSDTTNNEQKAPREATKAQAVAKVEEFKRLTKSELISVWKVPNVEKAVEYLEKTVGKSLSEFTASETEDARALLEAQKIKREKALKEQAENAEIPFAITD